MGLDVCNHGVLVTSRQIVREVGSESTRKARHSMEAPPPSQLLHVFWPQTLPPPATQEVGQMSMWLSISIMRQGKGE